MRMSRLTFSITVPVIHVGNHVASSSSHSSISTTRRRKRVQITACGSASASRRCKLVNLIGREYTLKNPAVEEAIDELVSFSSEEVIPLKEGWEASVNGRWGLRYSTEPLLGKLLAGNRKNYSYQLFRAWGVVENVVEFSGTGQLRIEAEYVARGNERGFDYDFKRTRIVYGNILDFTLPFAQGDGFVSLVWLDHALRIDKSLLGGKSVTNVYVYEGPVEQCKVGKNNST